MDKLVFRGHIGSGVGNYSKMVIPGRTALACAPDDWPETLYPGSLNVKIVKDRYPDELLARCAGKLLQKLDSQVFSPAFEIPHDAIKGNKL